MKLLEQGDEENEMEDSEAPECSITVGIEETGELSLEQLGIERIGDCLD